MPTTDRRYPVGKVSRPKTSTASERKEWIEEIAALPGQLRTLASSVDDSQLDTPYRPGGWTARQVIHHLPDSHANAYIRFRLALTEDHPAIKPYDEARWAELPDARQDGVEASLAFLEALHVRWVSLMRTMTEDQWRRTYEHPESGTWRLDEAAAVYAWHGRHHLGHVRLAAEGEAG